MRENFRDDWDRWSNELLADEDWCATLVRYSGKGVETLKYAKEAMALFGDFLVLRDQVDSARSKTEYQYSFIGWWRYNGWAFDMDELRGLKKPAPRIQTKPLSRIDEMQRVCEEAKIMTRKMLKLE